MDGWDFEVRVEEEISGYHVPGGFFNKEKTN